LKQLTEAIIRTLWDPSGDPGEVYAVLDAARDTRIYPRVRGLVGARCLYEGKIEAPLAETAPYLTLLDARDAFTASLLAEGWGRCWGIFLSSAASLEEVRRHLRQFLKVQDERGQPLYFRFYDPRVLRVYLPTCNAKELEMLFGPVQRFWCEGDGGHNILQFERKGSRLKQRAVALPAKEKRC
jgi:hypothetical protein